MTFSISRPRPAPVPLFIWFAIGLVYGLCIGAAAAIKYCRTYGC